MAFREPTEAELRQTWARFEAARTGRAAPIGATERPVAFEEAIADPLLRPLIHAAAVAWARKSAAQTPPRTTACAVHRAYLKTMKPAGIDRKRAAAGDHDEDD